MMNSKSGHIDCFDPLRLIAAIGVIYMHTAAGLLREGVNTGWHLMNVCTSFTFTAVPLFFMMSGYLLMTGEKTADVSLLLKKRLPRLLVPLIGWTVVAALWYSLTGHSFTLSGIGSRVIGALYSPAALHFWYLYTLIALYAVSPFLYGAMRSLDEKGRRYLLVIILLISLKSMACALLPEEARKYASLDILNKLSFFEGHLATFLLGYLLGTTEKKLPNGLLLGVSIALLAVISAGTWYLTVSGGEFDQSFQNQAAGFEVLLAGSIFLLFKQGFFRSPPWLRDCPLIPLLLPVYLMHGILIDMFGAVGLVPASFLGTAGMTLLNLTVCYLVMKTVATVKPLCYLATGLRFQEACGSCNWIYTFNKIKSRHAKA